MILKYLLTLSPSVVVWRLLKIIGINRFIQFGQRRKLLLSFENVTASDERSIEINTPYTNESIQIHDNSFLYTIGTKTKKIDFTNTRFDNNDYIFDYLIWYRNWLLDIKEDLHLYESLIFYNKGISIYAHPISNTLINYILIYDRLTHTFGKNRVNKFLVDSYNQLVINTEEYTGGNHLIDNYISLLSLSFFYKYYEISNYWDRKLCGGISQFGIPEDNVSYAKLILWKIDGLCMRLGEINSLVKLKKNILLAYPYIYKSLIPTYNDNYIPIINLNYGDFEYNNSRYYYSSNRNGLLVFFLKNGLSQRGNHGHDHDSSLSLQIWMKNKCLIGPKGTSHYSNDGARDELRKRSSGSKFFPESEHMIFFNSFRVLPLKTVTIKLHTGYEIISLGADELYFSYIDGFDQLSLNFGLNQSQNKFTFYSDEDWIYNIEGNSCFCNNIRINGVDRMISQRATRFNGLYNESITNRIDVFFGSKIEFLIKKGIIK